MNKLKDKQVSIVLLLISLLFYIFFAVYDGAVMSLDSPSYIYMHTSREPFYCSFLALMRTLVSQFSSNNELYFTVVVYIQSLLAAWAAWALADYLKRELALTYYAECVIMCIPLAVSFLCRFAAKRSSMYSNSIMTEGIACSLFLLFARYLLEFYYKKSVKCIVISSLFSFILISTRKQMYITLVLLVIVVLSAYLPKLEIKKSIITVIVCTCGILISNILFDNAYNLVAHGELGTHSSDNRFLATMVFYTSERDYGERIEDEHARELFYQIYDVCDEQGYLGHSAGKGWYNRVNHFGDHYDHIQIDTMWRMIQNYVYDNYEGGAVYLEKVVDDTTNQIIMGLLPVVWPDVLHCFADNFLSGLITTIAQRKPVLIIYSLLAYLMYLVMLVIQIRTEGITKLSFLAIFTMLSIVINVAVVSMVIFCQTRYAIYNMPLFYISIFLLFLKNISILSNKLKTREA